MNESSVFPRLVSFLSNCLPLYTSPLLIYTVSNGANLVVVTAFETTHAAVAQRAALPALRCAGVDVVVYDLGLAPPVQLAMAAEFGSPSFTWELFPFDEV
jgi:hypothetical protein